MDEGERERRELQIDLVEIQVRIKTVSLFTAIFFSAFISLFTAGYITKTDRITLISIPYGIVAIILSYWLYQSPWKKLKTIREKHIHPLASPRERVREVELTEAGKIWIQENHPPGIVWELNLDKPFTLHSVAAEFVELSNLGVSYRIPHEVDGKPTIRKAVS